MNAASLYAPRIRIIDPCWYGELPPLTRTECLSNLTVCFNLNDVLHVQFGVDTWWEPTQQAVALSYVGVSIT